MPLDFETARAAVCARLSEAAAGHCERVAETAARLAAAYGADVQAARLAGLLHDWHRETDGQELLRLAARYRVPVSPADALVPYLLHAPVAAAELGVEHPDLPEDVLSAIRAHTIGAVTMSPLDKIVYVADVIEPARRHDSAGALRSAAGAIPLDELFARTYLESLMHVVERRRVLHPDTPAVYNAHVAGGRS